VRGISGDGGIPHLIDEFRSVLRSLTRQPGYTVVAALVLSVGIRADATVFSFLNAIVWRPFPYATPIDAVQPLHPETLADHDSLCGGRNIGTRRQASGHWLHAERGKEVGRQVGRHSRTSDPCGDVAAEREVARDGDPCKSGIVLQFPERNEVTGATAPSLDERVVSGRRCESQTNIVGQSRSLNRCADNVHSGRNTGTPWYQIT
jgi:hypothetical protein